MPNPNWISMLLTSSFCLRISTRLWLFSSWCRKATSSLTWTCSGHSATISVSCLSWLVPSTPGTSRYLQSGPASPWASLRCLWLHFPTLCPASATTTVSIRWSASQCSSKPYKWQLEARVRTGGAPTTRRFQTKRHDQSLSIEYLTTIKLINNHLGGSCTIM